MRTYLRYFYLAVFFSISIVACKKEVEPENQPSTGRRPLPPVVGGNPTTPPSATVHITLGNPSNAVTDPTQLTNYLMTKPQYALSYNNERGTPNWVSWHLDNTWLGGAGRQDDYRADVSLPPVFFVVNENHYEYALHGFQRGHLCPSADRTRSIADNSATFLMTNMIPQAPNHNDRTWGDLEDYCRKLVSEGKELYIIAGAYGKGGTGISGYRETIAGGKVTVPSRVWKVIVIIPSGDDDLNRITTTTARVIAIDTPNENSANPAWGIYRTSIDAIELATGYNLLSALSQTLQATIEAKVDDGPTK